MVYWVCRDVLENREDAEDALQATFLVLVRVPGRYASGSPCRAGCSEWRRVANRSRLDAARRRKRDLDAAGRIRLVHEERPLDELRAVLDDELTRLPEKYREPVLLCDMGGPELRPGRPEDGLPSRHGRRAAHAGPSAASRPARTPRRGPVGRGLESAG